MNTRSDPVSDDFLAAAKSFVDDVDNFVKVWKHSVVPVVQAFAESASRGELLLADGRRVRIRKIPLPPGLTRADAAHLIRACDELGIDPDAEGEQYETLIRYSLGEAWFRHLALEGEFVLRTLGDIGESVARQTIQLAFVQLNNLRERFYGEIRELLGVLGGWENSSDLVAPITRLLGLSPARWPHQDASDLVRRLSNDIKHNGGRARQSAKALGIQKGTEIALNIPDLESCSEGLQAHAMELTNEIVKRRFGFGPGLAVEDWQNEQPEGVSPTPTYEWLVRFVAPEFQTEFLVEWLSKCNQRPEGD